jgi:transcriptional regulator with XRE-family HTH domain
VTGSRTAAAATPRGSTPLRIGVRLRAARLSQKLTIGAVAEATGLTKGFISRLERDAASPSVASLVAVCEAIGLRVGSLFDPPETAVVRAGTGRPISFGAVRTSESLLTPGTQQQLEVIHSLLDGGGHGGDELYSLDCEVEFVYVVGGRLELVLEDQTVELGPGDAMTFPGRTPHTWRNAAPDDPCEVLWVLSPTP